jgi:hypothetical protein
MNKRLRVRPRKTPMQGFKLCKPLSDFLHHEAKKTGKTKTRIVEEGLAALKSLKGSVA